MTTQRDALESDLKRRVAELEQELKSSLAERDGIARENARLVSETKEALARQTATSDILRVISQSPTDVQPVFDSIVLTAARLIRRDRAFILRCDATTYWLVAMAGPEGPLPVPDLAPVVIDTEANFPSRAIVTKNNLHLPDWSAVELPEYERHIRETFGFNSALYLPLLREGECIGLLGIAGTRAGIFGDNEIALAESFRDQALIAIENTRLFNETKEALERQTATADILKVIASSPSDVQPVFEAIVDSAARLFEPCAATIVTLRDEVLDWNATAALRPDFDVELARAVYPIPFAPERLPSARAIAERRIVEILDTDAPDTPDTTRQAGAISGFRSATFVPLINDKRGIGTIILTHPQAGFRLSEKQLALVQTFADQAVIAIENARLFDEVQTRTKELAASLDDLRAAQDRLVQTEKLASLGQLTAGIAHEIKNPLNFVNNFSALSAELVGEIKDALSDIDLDKNKREELDEIAQMLKDNLEKVVQHGKRADSIVKNMLQHSREGSGEHRPADINAIVDESLNLAYHGARAEKAGFSIALQRDLDPSVGTANVYPQEITRVLLNLISNGFYATTKRKAEAGDGFEPTLFAATKDLGDKIEIRIRDNGTGIPEGVKDKIFNPFFTTKPTGEGTGLGLSMSHDIIVKQHGGSIEVATEPGLFTEFKIVLPRKSQR